MTSPDDIVLKKVDEVEEKKLPTGVYAITFNDRLVFVRRMHGRFVLVSAKEQEELCRHLRP